jgi:hypothetical protein
MDKIDTLDISESLKVFLKKFFGSKQDLYEYFLRHLESENDKQQATIIKRIIFKLIEENTFHNFDSIEPSDLIKYQNQIISLIAVTENISKDVAYLAFENCKWNISNFVNITRNELISQLKIPEELVSFSSTLVNPDIDCKCPICLEIISKKSIFVLPCGHFACTSCWKDHIEVNSKDFSIMKCFNFNQDCSFSVPFKKIKLFWENSEIETKFEEKVNNHRIESSTEFFHCPNSKCHQMIKIPQENDRSYAKCKCGAMICLKCKKLDHSPFKCSDNINIIIDDNNDLDIRGLYNLKHCPNCGMLTNKIDGCNWTQCVSCKTGFCWCCGKHPIPHAKCPSCDFVTHTYEPFPSLQGSIDENQKKLLVKDSLQRQFKSEAVEQEKRENLMKKLEIILMEKETNKSEVTDFLINFNFTIINSRNFVKNIFNYLVNADPKQPEFSIKFEEAKTIETELDKIFAFLTNSDNFLFIQVENSRKILEKMLNSKYQNIQ